ncbi:sigma-70 family RNA polymerase sigma factor, partial [bacterium]|nr:sigma-70 family RNA polymerase sigma factor [bacterium]
MLTVLRQEDERSRREEDQALAKKARDGDHDAFRVLYERYAPAVLGFLRNRIGDAAFAEDALQETFLKAHRSLDSYDRSRPFGPWIGTIADNVARDHFRRKRPRGALPLEEEPVAKIDLSQTAARREGEAIVRAALAALPDEPRAVLVFRYQKGMTQREVSEQLGCSLRTAQTREETALALLATLLDA